MADSITKCVAFLTPSNELDHRVVHYHFIYGAYSKDISVVISAAEMNDPTDLDECKTLANTKAAIEKSKWISSLAAQSNEAEIVGLNGSVSL